MTTPRLREKPTPSPSLLVRCKPDERRGGMTDEKLQQFYRSIHPDDEASFLCECAGHERTRERELLADFAQVYARFDRAKLHLADRQLALEQFRREPQPGAEWAKCLTQLQHDVEQAEIAVTRERELLEQPSPQKLLAALRMDLEQVRGRIAHIVKQLPPGR